MKSVLVPTIIALLQVSAAALEAQAAAKPKLSDAEFVRAAEAAAPARIATQAAVARMDADGKLTPIREGKNGFTCTLFPDMSDAPVCGDANALAFLVAAITNQPKPPNTAPGIAYMAKGGMHFETPEGEVVLHPSATTKLAKEPPHWMVLWPVDAASGIPTRPNAGGTYIMFAGTPFAHLMIYQDPTQF